jgi:hypothetical protein
VQTTWYRGRALAVGADCLDDRAGHVNQRLAVDRGGRVEVDDAADPADLSIRATRW